MKFLIALSTAAVALAASGRTALAQAAASPRSVALEGQGQAHIPAQADNTLSVAVQVTDSSGESIFLDQGRDAGISVGNRVLLYSRTHGILAGSIQAVSRKSSNCRLDVGTVAVEVGTRGEVFVPKRPPAAEAPGREERPARPEHPPWTHAPQDWNADSPLLLPAFSRAAAERPAEVTGFAFARGSYTTNQFGTGNQYLLGEAGADVSLLHAVPGEGVIRLRGEYLTQTSRIDGAPDTRESGPRLDWFSCVWGQRRDSFRAEMGRFLQHEFAELGLLDGGEGRMTLGDHWRFGGSLGAMPDYRRRVEITGDYQGAVFAKYLSGPREEFSIGVAYQRTLHEGEWDRDLLVTVAEFIPSQKFSARASLWIDYYTGSELVKSQGFELTEAHASASYRFDLDNNVGAFFTRHRRPDVLRDELFPPGQQPTPELAEMLKQNLAMYYGVYSWHRLSARIVADTRISLWSDQTNESGISGEAHVGIQDWLFDKGEIGLTAFYTDGIYTRGPGARLSMSRLFAPVSILGWYEAAFYENVATGSSAIQHTLHLSVDAALSETWSMSLSADYRFGFQQESMTLLFSIMMRLR